MNGNKVHSKRTVLPFSWESKPGVSRDTNDDHHIGVGGSGDFSVVKLPPPPCPPKEKKSKASFQRDLQIPPPPSANLHQHPFRSSSLRRSSKKMNDDPFLIAYLECTKSARDDRKWSGVSSKLGDGGFGIKKNLSLFSCKHSSNVIDNSIVRVSQLPTSKSQRFLRKED